MLQHCIQSLGLWLREHSCCRFECYCRNRTVPTASSFPAAVYYISILAETSCFFATTPLEKVRTSLAFPCKRIPAIMQRLLSAYGSYVGKHPAKVAAAAVTLCCGLSLGWIKVDRRQGLAD
jgi:hypothetical protein